MTIKKKKKLERDRREAIKQSFASATSKILQAKKRLMMRNADIKTGDMKRSNTNTDYGNP